MALFQPTNIIPSTFTTGAVDVEKDNVLISWQVNGNSAMTAFKIDMLENNDSSTQVATTGRLTDNCPFYGTNRFGAVQMFAYSLASKWQEKWSGLSNGKEYKIKITQYWNENGTEKSLVQIASEVFKTASTPTITIQQTDKDYKNAVTLSNTLATSIGYFHASYTQAQGDGVRFVQWQMANATYNSTTNKWTRGDILADTGDINTPTLDYEFNGFFNSYNPDGSYRGGYAIRCIVESESGQTATVWNKNSDGWVFFNVSIENIGIFRGNFTAQCLRNENATLLSWKGNEILPTILPTSYNPILDNGTVQLEPNSSIIWSGLDFSPQWAVAYNVKIQKQEVVEFFGKPTDERIVNTYNESGSGSFSRTYNYDANAGEVNVSVAITFGRGITNYTIDKQKHQVTINFVSSVGGVLRGRVELVSHIYKYAETKSFNGVVTELRNTYSINTLSRETSFSDNSVTVTAYGKSSDNIKINTTVSYRPALSGQLLNIGNGNVILTYENNSIRITANDTPTNNIDIPDTVYSLTALVSPTMTTIFKYGIDTLIEKQSVDLTYAQSIISSVAVLGGTLGATVGNISVYQGDGANIEPLYNNPRFEPDWQTATYALYMTVDFNNGLNAGLLLQEGNGFRVYRQEVGKNELSPIALIGDKITKIKDYGTVSGMPYAYHLYAYDKQWNYMTSVKAQEVICSRFQNYSLMVCDYDYNKDAYHVRKQYLFKCNLSVGAVSNNNAPTLNKNFTRYPTRMGDTANYASGTLSGLIGAIYTVPALIEQIGAYKRTIKPSTLDYFDSVDLEMELNALSTAPYQLFLRDMKGHLYMVATSGAITMTTDIKKGQQPITMSLPWVEIGDASNVTIIQTPDDYGWNNDNQLLATTLDVDPETGDLMANYPYPYNGTTFRLTGVQSEVLTAETPIGVTPAQFSLSNTANTTTDGELNATVTINSEDN